MRELGGNLGVGDGSMREEFEEGKGIHRVSVTHHL